MGLKDTLGFQVNHDLVGYNWMKATNSIFQYNGVVPTNAWNHFALAWKSGVSLLNKFNLNYADQATAETLDSSLAQFYFTNMNAP